MVSVLNLFRRKVAKWHDVRWRHGQRQIFLSLCFAADGARPADHALSVEPLPPNGATRGGAVHADAAGRLIAEVRSAVDEYNRMNLCALRVAHIRHRSTPDATPTDYGLATRKLLNLL